MNSSTLTKRVVLPRIRRNKKPLSTMQLRAKLSRLHYDTRESKRQLKIAADILTFNIAGSFLSISEPDDRTAAEVQQDRNTECLLNHRRKMTLFERIRSRILDHVSGFLISTVFVLFPQYLGVGMGVYDSIKLGVTKLRIHSIEKELKRIEKES